MSFGGHTGQINEGYGEDVVVQYDGWVKAAARRLCADVSRREDVIQEGRISLWQTYASTGEISYAIRDAEHRMKQMAWYSPPPTGSVHEGPRYEPRGKVSVEALAESTTDEYAVSVLGLVDNLTDVEWAYHRGEILAALNVLTPRQRQYVYARFWCGMESVPGSRVPEGLALAREMNPVAQDRSGVLWSGNKTTTGAKARLVEVLGHLRDLVAA